MILATFVVRSEDLLGQQQHNFVRSNLTAFTERYFLFTSAGKFSVSVQFQFTNSRYVICCYFFKQTVVVVFQVRWNKKLLLGHVWKGIWAKYNIFLLYWISFQITMYFFFFLIFVNTVNCLKLRNASWNVEFLIVLNHTI